MLIANQGEGHRLVAWTSLCTTGKLPNTQTNFAKVFQGSISTTSISHQTNTCINEPLQLKIFLTRDYVHHTRTQIQKLNLKGDNWLIAYFVNGISNSNYHWIQYINGSLVQFLFDSQTSHNFDLGILIDFQNNSYLIQETHITFKVDVPKRIINVKFMF